MSIWHGRWQTGGTDALRSKGPSGPAPRLSDAQLARIEQALLEGATANGFVGELWTLDRVALVNVAVFFSLSARRGGIMDESGERSETGP